MKKVEKHRLVVIMCIFARHLVYDINFFLYE